jgi:anti-sigma regulatory factor (Ser/Thr protein kinase)
MATVRLSFSPAPAHVRTARLVAVAVARRAGVAEELLEEIRLAIGEACSRAVALHRTQGVEDMVDVKMYDEGRFTVRVVDRAVNGTALNGPPTDPAAFLTESGGTGGASNGGEGLTEEAVAARMGLALLAGLVDDLEVATLRDGVGTEVCMSWPLPSRAS